MTIRRKMGKFLKISPIHPVSASPFHVSFLVPALQGYGFINYLQKYEGKRSLRGNRERRPQQPE